MAVLFRASSVETRSGGGSGSSVRAFTLVELLLVLCMGLALSAVLVQLLVAESRLGAVMVRQWRERTLQRRQTEGRRRCRLPRSGHPGCNHENTDSGDQCHHQHGLNHQPSIRWARPRGAAISGDAEAA